MYLFRFGKSGMSCNDGKNGCEAFRIKHFIKKKSVEFFVLRINPAFLVPSKACRFVTSTHSKSFGLVFAVVVVTIVPASECFVKSLMYASGLNYR